MKSRLEAINTQRFRDGGGGGASTLAAWVFLFGVLDCYDDDSGILAGTRSECK